MASANIRKIVTIVEETRSEADRPIQPATRRAAAVAVIENPFAGRYVEDLEALMVIGEEWAHNWETRAWRTRHLASRGTSYGKAALVGENGGWNTLRPFCIKAWQTVTYVEKGAALVLSNKKRGGMGHR